ncbi:MAG: N-acetyltransferase family protein [Actinomycetota bacterium]|nr:N-acetyltransferase family protein [Actinomycetota bacterium]
MELRLARPDDAEAIRAIYNAEVVDSTVTFDMVPRTVEQQQAWMSEHAGAYAAIVAVEGDEVIGFASLAPYRPRPAYATTVEDSVYVRRDRRGKGYGRALLSELVAVATRHGFHAIIARILDRHEASIRLHRDCGFELVGTEREVGRKFGKWLDVVVMQRLL